jgi:hypothetical protein
VAAAGAAASAAGALRRAAAAHLGQARVQAQPVLHGLLLLLGLRLEALELGSELLQHAVPAVRHPLARLARLQHGLEQRHHLLALALGQPLDGGLQLGALLRVAGGGWRVADEGEGAVSGERCAGAARSVCREVPA